MDVSPSVDKLITALKQEFRANGIRHRDIAVRLGISDITVKRYLAGKGMAIGTLERMAGLVDLDLLSLAALAQQRSRSVPEFNEAQQAALGKNKILLSIFFLLLRGWTPVRIAEEFEVQPESLEAALTELERLALIRRVSTHRVDMLARPNDDWRGRNELAEMSRDLAQQFLSEIDLGHHDTEWIYYGARLSGGSTRQVREMIATFMEDIRALARRDAALRPADVRWYRLFIGAEPRKKPILL